MSDVQGLDRRAAMSVLLENRSAALVVSGLGTPSYDLFAAGDRNDNFYLWGAMGGAAMCGLGLALAQPTRPVLVVTGDGEQLMAMGALATIGAKAPPNLAVIVFDNRHYGETGMQPSHTGLGVDLCGVARSCGFASARAIETIDGVRALAAELALPDEGPRFASIRVSAAPQPRALPTRDGVFLKNRFRAYLGYPPN